MDRNQLLNDAEAAQIYALDGRQAKTRTAMPGTIQAVDFIAMTVQIQPAIQAVYTNDNLQETYVNLPLLVDCPIIFPTGGGFTLTFPIAIGDECLVVIADRCIDAWWQNGCVNAPFTQPPMEMRMHDLSDGFAILGPRSQPHVLTAISTTTAQLRNDAGTVFLEIANTGINITGNLVVTGTITATVDVIGGPDDISLTSHTHPVTDAPGETGPPAP